MDGCLNVLYRPEIFLPSTALIVIILLVWAQLAARGQDKVEFTVELGFAWIYLAIFFALLAFGLHVLEFKRCAIGFLGLSFLMAIVHVLFSALRKIWMICMHRPEWEPFVQEGTLIRVRSSHQKRWLFWTMVVTMVGLSIFSFSLAFRFVYWWTLMLGGILVAVAAGYVLCKIFRGMENDC